jgi:hypothetical protein
MHGYVTRNWSTGHRYLLWSIRNVQLDQDGRAARLYNDFIREAHDMSPGVGTDCLNKHLLLFYLTFVLECRIYADRYIFYYF